jgi:Delta3-Delta2-enoyl-CoA isomerase
VHERGAVVSLPQTHTLLTSLPPSQIVFGAPWPHAFARLLRAKVGDGRIQRKIALEGHRFTPPEALEAGLVDALVPGATEDVLKHALGVATKTAPNAKSGVWGLIKVSLLFCAAFVFFGV